MGKRKRESSNEEGEIENLLHKLYYDPKESTAFTSAENIYREAKNIDKNITRSIVQQWLQKQLTATLHKPLRFNFPRNKTIVVSIDDQWQADLCDMSRTAKYNDGTTFILTCIDCFSKYAWLEPLKRKTDDEIVEALKRILKSGRRPKRLQTDKGTEFVNRKVQSLLKQNGIDFFTTNSEQKASIVERFNRTMKGRMYKYFTAKNTYRYIDVMQDLVDGYNNTYHRSIKMKPINVRVIDQTKIRRHLYGAKEKAKRRPKKYKYMVGDLVRISKERLVFGKGYLPNWTEEIFLVYDRNFAKEPQYYVRDYAGEDVKGGFYEYELQPIQDQGEYRIEKVLRRKTVNGRVLHLVKWKGWDSKFNSWVENPRRL